MPAASEAGSAEKWLDRALAARPDLVPPLAAVLDAAAGKDPDAEARRLHADDPDGFSALAQIASGGYYMNLKVRKRDRLPGPGQAAALLRRGRVRPARRAARPGLSHAGRSTRPRLRPPDPVEPAAAALVLDLGERRRRRPTCSSSAPALAARWRRATWPRPASRSSASSRAAGRTPPTSPATSSSGSSSPTRSGARTRTRGSTRPTTRSRSRARRSRRSCTTRSAGARSTSAPSGCACGRRTTSSARSTGSPTTGPSPTRR